MRKVDVAATNVYWSTTDTVCIATNSSFFVLKFNRVAFQTALEGTSYDYEEGVEEALEFICESKET